MSESTASMPEQVGTFKVIRRLGIGTFTEAWLGEDTSPQFLGDKVTIKRVRLDLLTRDPLFRSALLMEGEAGLSIEHPNVIRTYQTIEEEGIPYLITEYVDGVLLSEVFRDAGGPIAANVVAEMARQISEGLGALHNARDATGAPLGIVHQDLRPSNICMTRRGEVKLLDLGVARSRLVGQGGVRFHRNASPYDSPEQARGETYLTPASDQYSLGVVVLELLLGRPFLDILESLAQRAEKQAEALLNALQDAEDALVVQVEETPAAEKTDDITFSSHPPKEPDARADWARRELTAHLTILENFPGAGLDDILTRMLAYDPGDRYASMAEAAEEILRWAWGVAGVGVDFRGYAEEVIDRIRGSQQGQVRHDLKLDAELLKEAMDSSFLPPDLRETSPDKPPKAAAESELRPENVPGAIVGVRVGADAPTEGDDTFAVSTDPAIALKRLQASAHAKEARSQAAATQAEKIRVRNRIRAGAALLALGIILGLGYHYRGRPAPSQASPTPQHPRPAPHSPSSGVEAMFEGRNAASHDASPESPTSHPTRDGQAPPKNTVEGLLEGKGKLPPEHLTPFIGKSRPGTAYLTVATSPPGATVILDGIAIEESPITFEAIQAGEHQIILRNEELGLRHEQVIDLKPNKHWRGTWSFRENRWIALE